MELASVILVILALDAKSGSAKTSAIIMELARMAFANASRASSETIAQSTWSSVVNALSAA